MLNNKILLKGEMLLIFILEIFLVLLIDKRNENINYIFNWKKFVWYVWDYFDGV